MNIIEKWKNYCKHSFTMFDDDLYLSYSEYISKVQSVTSHLNKFISKSYCYNLIKIYNTRFSYSTSTYSNNFFCIDSEQVNVCLLGVKNIHIVNIKDLDFVKIKGYLKIYLYMIIFINVTNQIFYYHLRKMQ